MGIKALNLLPRHIYLAMRSFVVLFVALNLSACAGSIFPDSSKKVANVPEQAPQKLYTEADTLLGSRNFQQAAKKFENVDRLHPYSPLARKSIVMSAYAYYKHGEYVKAAKAALRYIKLHPGTKEAAFAQHIIAMSHYEQVRDPKRDQSRSIKALAALKDLVARYPKSKYAAAARNRIRVVSDVIAAAEMNVGRYYMKRNNYVAAINRFKTVVKKYQTTQQVEEALMRLTEAYLALGVANEAQTAAAILGHNFPSSKWYKDAYALLQSNGLTPEVHQGSWLTRSWSTTTSSARI